MGGERPLKGSEQCHAHGYADDTIHRRSTRIQRRSFLYHYQWCRTELAIKSMRPLLPPRMMPLGSPTAPCDHHLVRVLYSLSERSESHPHSPRPQAPQSDTYSSPLLDGRRKPSLCANNTKAPPLPPPLKGPSASNSLTHSSFEKATPPDREL